MKTYQVRLTIEETDHDAGCSVNTETSNIGPEFTFLDQAMTLKNSLVNMVSVLQEQSDRDRTKPTSRTPITAAAAAKKLGITKKELKARSERHNLRIQASLVSETQLQSESIIWYEKELEEEDPMSPYMPVEYAILYTLKEEYL